MLFILFIFPAPTGSIFIVVKIFVFISVFVLLYQFNIDHNTKIDRSTNIVGNTPNVNNVNKELEENYDSLLELIFNMLTSIKQAGDGKETSFNLFDVKYSYDPVKDNELFIDVQKNIMKNN